MNYPEQKKQQSDAGNLPLSKRWYQHRGLLAIIILAVITVGVTVIYFKQADNCNPPGPRNPKCTLTRDVPISKGFTQPQPIQNQTQAWQTYKNKKYGFEFQYPGDAAITINDSGISKSRFSLQLMDKGIFLADIYIYTDSPDAEAYQWFQKKLPAVLPGTEISGPMQIVAKTINGISGIEVYGSNQESRGFFDSFYFKKAGQIWQISLDPILENRVKKEYFDETYFGKNETAYRKFWSSFKLTDTEIPNYTKIDPNWIAYYNEQDNYIIQFPQSYKGKQLTWTMLTNFTQSNASTAMLQSRLANKAKYQIDSDCLPEDKDESSQRCVIIGLNPYVIKSVYYPGLGDNWNTELDFMNNKVSLLANVDAELDFAIDKKLLEQIVSTFKILDE